MTSSSKPLKSITYNEIINENAREGGAMALKGRLTRFRKWATKQAGITAHGAICIVNGEATDGTRNAPILTYEAPKPVPGSEGGGSGGASAPGANAPSEVRCGAIDSQPDRAMYDRSIGCQVRTVRELKKDEVALSIPPSAMLSPALIAASDAGQAVFACCSSSSSEFWDMFSATNKLEKNQAEKIQQNSGTQLLVKILQERKKVETALMKAERIAIEAGEAGNDAKLPKNLVKAGSISYRAPFLAFLIHQRFANEGNPSVASSTRDLPRLRPDVPVGAPGTFAPYARTLPTSICLPICWKRNELALLAGCIPGMPLLQKVAARTMQLSTELMALMDAGFLWRFPSIFSPGMITWDRWVWAAAVYESRVFSTYSLPAWIFSDAVSPKHVIESCGIMIPFLDMLNHEDEAAQVEWNMSSQNLKDRSNSDDATNGLGCDDADIKRLSVTTNTRSKKHVQIYRDYGSFSNEIFMMQYGFARMSNPFDKVRIAWSLVDGVGGVSPPPDYDQAADDDSIPPEFRVYESSDADSVKLWWTEQRLSMLGKALTNSSESLEMLKKGKRVTFSAQNNGKIDFNIVAVAVVATLPHERVLQWFQKSNAEPSNAAKPLLGSTLDKNCQSGVRKYLNYLFTKKLEKLLQSLNSCLKNHFNSVQLWTKATCGGLNYASGSEGSLSADASENTSAVIGWQSFFDTYAYNSTMEVENRYYAMAPDSCVLTLYDGHVRSLQNSLDAMESNNTFLEKVKQHLENLGCSLVEADEISSKMTSKPTLSIKMEVDSDETPQKAETESTDSMKKDSLPSPKKETQGNGNTNSKDGRQTKKVDRPPAIKLHIGNLSYQTLPNELYDFFTNLYGKDSVLECHIPTERDTGNSRGFGFVTMPEEFAKAALQAGRTHEMNGRILKVAESNSAGTGKGSKGRAPAIASDRCPYCGYRPRWCTCNPNLGTMNIGIPPPDSIYGPGPFIPPPMGGPGYGPPHDLERRRGDGYGWGGDLGVSGGWAHNRSYSRSPSYRRGRDRGYRSRSRSRSHSRGRDRKDRDRHRGRERHDDRRRYGGGSRDDDRRRSSAEEWDRDRSSRHSSRNYRSKSKSRSRSRQHDDGGSQGRRAEEGGGNFSAEATGGRSRSRSRSPTDNAVDRSSSSKKREGKDSSGRDGRSRSRERERASRRRKRSKGSRRGKESSSSAKRRGGSRSRSRH
mmetsp:Transcript_12256/g.25890  ORF Transcript_12256/g.25890 Transcript_12256/m.25890 type:complete len:1191 (-) Transcript_12256:213-3785(-)